jgi:hypothetical protein
LALSVLLSDPFLNLLEDVGHVEVEMLRRCRHYRDLCPSLRKLSLEDGERQFWSDFGLPRKDVDHAGFETGFGLPHQALKRFVWLSTPPHPVREGLSLNTGQLSSCFPIAAATNGVKDNRGTMIRELGLPTL